MKLKRILVPVDFSEDSLNALDYAREFAKPFKAELAVLFVVEPVYYATPSELYGPTTNLAMLLDEQKRIGLQQLEALAANLKKQRQTVRTLLQTGTPYRVIIDVAKRQGADMIIMATHGRTGLTHVLMGSVAERVVREAGCPVLTVRAAKRKAKAKKKK